MDQYNIVKRTVHHLEAGYVYFTKQPSLMRAVAGSAVVVCIWDQRLRFGGITMFRKPRTKDPKKATPQYGNVATRGLIKLMLEAGCQRENMVAQLFGGARPRHQPTRRVGDQNIQVAMEVLKSAGVLMLSSDVGGHVGRKIAFDTGTGESVVLKVHTLRDSDW